MEIAINISWQMTDKSTFLQNTKQPKQEKIIKRRK
jgi:hypothetical protein